MNAQRFHRLLQALFYRLPSAYARASLASGDSNGKNVGQTLDRSVNQFTSFLGFASPDDPQLPGFALALRTCEASRVPTHRFLILPFASVGPTSIKP